MDVDIVNLIEKLFFISINNDSDQLLDIYQDVCFIYTVPFNKIFSIDFQII